MRSADRLVSLRRANAVHPMLCCCWVHWREADAGNSPRRARGRLPLLACVHWREAHAGNSPRRASNFHLSRQMKVTKANALNASHLSPTLRPEKIMTFGRALPAFQHHAAGPAVVNSYAVSHDAARHFAQPHFQNPGPAVWCSTVPSVPFKGHDLFWPKRRDQMAGVEVVCFGDFHLDQQMKVTRPPGRVPARPRAEERRNAKPSRMEMR